MVSNIETIDPRHLRTFLEVVRRGGVTAAARAIGQPKSGVSKSLTALEARLATRLLERSTRRVSLTPAGEVLVGRAESILAELDRLVEDVHAHAQTVRGVVRVTAPPELGALLVERFFPVVLIANPGLELTVELGYAFEDLFDPHFDLAFRLGSVNDDRLVARRVGVFSRVLVASPGYVAAHSLRTPADLGRCNCLAFSGTELRATWTLVRGGARPLKREVEVAGNLAVHGFAALLRAAGAGVGIARVPDYLAAGAIAGGALVRVLPGWASPPTEVYLVYRFGHDRIKRVRAVLEAAQDSVAPLLAMAQTGA